MAGLWAITLGIHRSPFQLSTAPRGRRGRGARRPRFSMVLWTEWPDVLDSRLLSSTLGKLRGARCCCWEACPHLPTPFPLIFSGEIWTISVDWEVLPSRSIFNSWFGTWKRNKWLWISKLNCSSIWLNHRKKSVSTRGKWDLFTFRVDKSSSKMPKMPKVVHLRLEVN